jgi:hypothetical protein
MLKESLLWGFYNFLNELGKYMAGLMVLLNLVSVISNYGKTDASGFAVFSLLASIWAFGIFANFRQDPMNAPGYAVMLSTASGIAGVICLIIGLSS